VDVGHSRLHISWGPAVSEFAARDSWVVFTNDDDFFLTGGDHGLLLYDQLEDPSPGEVVIAVERIAAAYQSHAAVVETVPSEWV